MVKIIIIMPWHESYAKDASTCPNIYGRIQCGLFIYEELFSLIINLMYTLWRNFNTHVDLRS